MILRLGVGVNAGRVEPHDPDVRLTVARTPGPGPDVAVVVVEQHDLADGARLQRPGVVKGLQDGCLGWLLRGHVIPPGLTSPRAGARRDVRLSLSRLS